MDVSKGYDVSPIVAQSFKRPLFHQILLALLCLALLASTVVLKRIPVSVSAGLLGTARWPCRTTESTFSKYCQQDGTVSRSNGLHHDNVRSAIYMLCAWEGCSPLASSLCKVLVTGIILQERPVMIVTVTRVTSGRSPFSRITNPSRPHYINDSAHV